MVFIWQILNYHTEIEWVFFSFSFKILQFSREIQSAYNSGRDSINFMQDSKHDFTAFLFKYV